MLEVLGVQKIIQWDINGIRVAKKMVSIGIGKPLGINKGSDLVCLRGGICGELII